MVEPVSNQDIDQLLKQKKQLIMKKKQEEEEIKAKIEQESLNKQMKNVNLSSSLLEEEKKGSDDIDLIIGDTSALKRFESTSSSTEERKELGIRQIS